MTMICFRFCNGQQLEVSTQIEAKATVELDEAGRFQEFDSRHGQSVSSLLSESHSQARELRSRSTSVPHTREDLEASMGTIQASNLTSLYGNAQNEATRSTSIRKEETKESLVTARVTTRSRPSIKDDRLVGDLKRKNDDKKRSGSRLRSIRQLREEEGRRHKSGRKEELDSKSHRRKSSRSLTNDVEKSNRSKSSRRRSKEESQRTRESSRRGSRDETDDKSKSSRSKSRRRIKEREESRSRS